MTSSPTEKRRKKQTGWRIDADLADEFAAFCHARGWSPNRQIEAAIRDWLDGQSVAVDPKALEPESPEWKAYWRKREAGQNAPGQSSETIRDRRKSSERVRGGQ